MVPADTQSMHKFQFDITCDALAPVYKDLWLQMKNSFSFVELFSVRVRVSDFKVYGSNNSTTDLTDSNFIVTIPSTRLPTPKEVTGSEIHSMSGYKMVNKFNKNVYTFKIPKSQRNKVYTSQAVDIWHDNVTNKRHLTDFIDQITQSKWQFPHVIYGGIPNIFPNSTGVPLGICHIRLLVSMRFRFSGFANSPSGATYDPSNTIFSYELPFYTKEKIELAKLRLRPEPCSDDDSDPDDVDGFYADELINISESDVESEPEELEPIEDDEVE